MSQIARDPLFDSTLAILVDGYDFIWKRCRQLRTDLFLTRIMGKRAVCIHGREAAELFYDESKFQRHGALPRRVVTSLFGKKAVHTLDGAAHKQRKAAFLSLMAPASLERLCELMAEEWRVAILRWEQTESVVLFDESAQLLTRAVCRWAGVPISERELPQRAQDLVAMVDAFGGVGPRLWHGKLARLRAQLWLMGQIAGARREALPSGSALSVIATLRDADGTLLTRRTAAVELLNVLRPTVAIAWYITFAALALHQNPEARLKLARDDSYRDLFMQEVRRFYPFTPFLGARVREPFQWRGHSFRKGTLVLLDVHGTNHDPALWRDPQLFEPERFRARSDDPFAFIPQGGGSRMGHRCPGEWITMHAIALALHFLTKGMQYELAPGQDLSFSLRRLPTRPRSGFVIRRVRPAEAEAQLAPREPSQTAAREAAQLGASDARSSGVASVIQA